MLAVVPPEPGLARLSQSRADAFHKNNGESETITRSAAETCSELGREGVVCIKCSYSPLCKCP